MGSTAELDQIVLTDSRDKLVVVDYSTTWCGPCKLIFPKFEMLAEQYKDAIFLKVPAAHGARSRPTDRPTDGKKKGKKKWIREHMTSRTRPLRSVAASDRGV